MAAPRGYGACLDLPLQGQYTEASGIELLVDGNFAATGVAAWPNPASGISTKESCVPPAESLPNQCLRVSWTGPAVGYARSSPAPMVIGRQYRARGWFRVSLAAVEIFQVTDAVAFVYTAIISPIVWTWVDVTFIAQGTSLNLYCGNLAAGRYIECAGWSLQEVLQKTIDLSEFCDSVSYLCCNSNGAQECISIVKLEQLNRHTGALNTVADFSSSPGASAVFTLPSGLTYSCSSGSRTTQTSLSTIKTGINANEFPAFSIDGVNFAGIVEKASTNLIIRSNEFTLGLWLSGVGMGVIPNNTDGPDQLLNTATRITPTLIGSYLTTSFNGTQGVTYTFSYWVMNDSANQLRAIAYSAALGVNIAVVDLTAQMVVGAWRRVSITFTVPVGGTGVIYVYPHVQGIAPAGHMWIYGAQTEIGLYPTNYIPTAAAAVTRAAATLSCVLDIANTFSGSIPRLTIRPLFAYNETSYNATVLADSRSMIFYEQSTQRFAYEIGGKGRIQTPQVTFSRVQSLVSRADLNEGSLLDTLFVSGCTTGDATVQSYAAPRKAIICGDGYTPASFPVQLYPRGERFAGAQYLKTLSGDMFSTSVSLCAFFRMSKTTNYPGLIGNVITGLTYGVALTAENVGGLRKATFYCAGAGQYIVGTSDVADGLDHLVVGTYDVVSGLASIYVDGRLEQQAARTANLPMGAMLPYYVGKGGSADHFITASIRFVCRVPYALNVTQIKELHDRCKWEANT